MLPRLEVCFSILQVAMAPGHQQHPTPWGANAHQLSNKPGTTEWKRYSTRPNHSTLPCRCSIHSARDPRSSKHFATASEYGTALYAPYCPRLPTMLLLEKYGRSHSRYCVSLLAPSSSSTRTQRNRTVGEATESILLRY